MPSTPFRAPLSDNFTSLPLPFDDFSSQHEYQLAPPSVAAPSYPRLSDIPRYCPPVSHARSGDDRSSLYAAIGGGGSGIVLPAAPMMPDVADAGSLDLGPFEFDFSLPMT